MTRLRFQEFQQDDTGYSKTHRILQDLCTQGAERHKQGPYFRHAGSRTSYSMGQIERTKHKGGNPTQSTLELRLENSIYWLVTGLAGAAEYLYVLVFGLRFSSSIPSLSLHRLPGGGCGDGDLGCRRNNGRTSLSGGISEELLKHNCIVLQWGK